MTDAGDRWTSFAQRLNSGLDLDDELEQLYPDSIRRLSTLHWTPIRVVRKVIELLAPERGTRVLDVGSGVGKFCIVGSLLCEATFVGVEQRPDLVELARATARTVRAPRTSFGCGSVFGLDWRTYACVYLYNPFEEELFDTPKRIDDRLKFSEARYEECIELTLEKLSEMPDGTRVALYHGFGGELPTGYQREWSGDCGTGKLELWRRGELPKSGSGSASS